MENQCGHRRKVGGRERQIGNRGQGSFMSGHVFNIPRVGGGVAAAASLINLHSEAVLRRTDAASVRNVRH